jgi:hypothetical protein
MPSWQEARWRAKMGRTWRLDHTVFLPSEAQTGVLKTRGAPLVVLRDATVLPMIKLFVGITDFDWFQFLSKQPSLDETGRILSLVVILTKVQNLHYFELLESHIL